jgi:hypothetical protein
MTNDAIAVWRRQLSAFECFAMESCLRAYLMQLDYPLRYGSKPWRPLLAICALVLRAASLLLDRAIPYLQRRNWLPKPFYF